MRCTSLRRLMIAITVAGLAVLAGSPSWAQFKGGKGGGKGVGPGGFGGGVGPAGKKGVRGFGGPGGVAPAVVLPEGLNHVPYDAIAFVHIRVADSLNGPASQALLKQLRGDGEQGKLVGQIEKRLGVRLADLESITVFMLDLPGLTSALPAALARTADPDDSSSCLVALTYSKPVERKAVLRALADKGDAPIWPKLSAVFLSERCVLFGSPAELLSYTSGTSWGRSVVDDPLGAFGPGSFSPRTRGSLATALAAGAEPHLIVAGAQVPMVARTRLRLALRGSNIGPYGALLPLLNTTAAVTVDMREAAELTLSFIGADQLTLEAVQAARTLAELALDGKALAEGSAALSPDLHKAVRKAVAQATVEQVPNGRVEVRLRLDASADELARLLAQTVVRLR